MNNDFSFSIIILQKNDFWLRISSPNVQGQYFCRFVVLENLFIHHCWYQVHRKDGYVSFYLKLLFHSNIWRKLFSTMFSIQLLLFSDQYRVDLSICSIQFHKIAHSLQINPWSTQQCNHQPYQHNILAIICRWPFYIRYHSCSKRYCNHQHHSRIHRHDYHQRKVEYHSNLIFRVGVGKAGPKVR